MTAARPDADSGQVKVWDPVVRVFHWSLAAAVMLALISDEDRGLHEAVGYLALALILIRLLWGFIGPRPARFSSFVQPPGAILAYLGDVARFRARRYLGHNPAGGAMILLLMATVATAAVSGWLSQTDRFFAVAWVEDLHRASANLLIVLIVFHLIGVLLSSLMHGENLVRAMVTGRKPVAASRESESPTTP
ncbi:MAG TPA: cytochrome b/b6 domain-containing protein [Verrucomicrobiae bacterium]|jgi:cytochrome b|nr:cytochrome b/b6 domain-containing protein [Verrucomicrobiae bacterium]